MKQTPVERWAAIVGPDQKREMRELLKSAAFTDLLYAVWSQYNLGPTSTPTPQSSWDAHNRKLGAQDFMRQLSACLDESKQPPMPPFLSENLEPETPKPKPDK